jgi:hypothetical protein
MNKYAYIYIKEFQKIAQGGRRGRRNNRPPLAIEPAEAIGNFLYNIPGSFVNNVLLGGHNAVPLTPPKISPRYIDYMSRNAKIPSVPKVTPAPALVDLNLQNQDALDDLNARKQQQLIADAAYNLGLQNAQALRERQPVTQSAPSVLGSGAQPSFPSIDGLSRSPAPRVVQQGPDDEFLRKTMGSYDPKGSSRDRRKAEYIRSIWREGMTPNDIYRDKGYQAIS